MKLPNLFRGTPKVNPFSQVGSGEFSEVKSGELRVESGSAVELKAATATRLARMAPTGLERILRPEAAMNWLSPMLASMTPQRIEGILRGSMAGDLSQQWELFDLMEDTWPKLLKNLNEVKRTACALEWKIEAWAEEEEAPSESAQEKAKFVSRALWKMRPDPARGDNGFKATIYDILDAWGKGTSVLEILWKEATDGGGGIVPEGTAWVHPSHYAWGNDGVLGLMVNRNGQPQGLPGFNANIFTGGAQRGAMVAPFTPNKFLIAIARAKTGHASVSALLRPLAWWWCAANFSAEWLLNFGQIFGLPIRWATYDPSQPGLFEKICDMLENMGSTAWAAMPAGTNLDLKEASKSGGGSDTPQGNMLDRADRQCDLLILGQTLTSDVGQNGAGSRALGQVHQDVRADIIQAAGEFAAEVINAQLIPAILILNYGDDSEAPEFCPEPHKVEDAKANAERDQILAQMGMKLPEGFMHERHNIPMAQAGEAVLEAPQPALAGTTNPDPNASAAGASVTLDPTLKGDAAKLKARAAHQHQHDHAVDALLESVSGVEARWLGGLRPYYRELILMAENSADDAEFGLKLREVVEKSNEKFPDLFARMDVEFLADRFEGVMGASCANGAVGGYLQRGNGRRRVASGEWRVASSGGREKDFIINASPGLDAVGGSGARGATLPTLNGGGAT